MMANWLPFCIMFYRPDYQHQGIAGKMLQMIIEKYKDYLYIEGMPEERMRIFISNMVSM